MEREDTAALVAIITALWPNAPEYHAEHIEAFHLLLGDCDPEGVKRALASLAREGGAFPPNAGQVYRRYADLTDPIPDWGEAWGEVIGWVRSHGYVDPPTQDSFSHPAVYVALKRIGYQELCESATADAGVWQGHFRRIYDGAVASVGHAPDRAAIAAAHMENPFPLERGS